MYILDSLAGNCMYSKSNKKENVPYIIGDLGLLRKRDLFCKIDSVTLYLLDSSNFFMMYMHMNHGLSLICTEKVRKKKMFFILWVNRDYCAKEIFSVFQTL